MRSIRKPFGHWFRKVDKFDIGDVVGDRGLVNM